MISSGENIREHCQISDLCHGLVFVGELQQVPVRVGNHYIIGLPAYPAAHIDVAIRGPRSRWIDIEADAGIARFTHAAAPTRDIKGDGDQIADFDKLDIAACLDHFAGDLVAQRLALWRGGSASHHMLIAAADIGCHDLEDDAVVALAVLRR